MRPGSAPNATRSPPRSPRSSRGSRPPAPFAWADRQVRSTTTSGARERRGGACSLRVMERPLDRLAVREWGDRAAPGIVLWPGLGATGAYFASIAEALPGRGVAVDPPGFGRSPPLDDCTYSALVELAGSVVAAVGGHAMVGHSLGAHIAAGVACDPPAGLRAVVLIDGGFMDAERLAEVGMPA